MYNYFFSIPYVVVAIILCVISYRNNALFNKSRHIYYSTISFILICLFWGFRGLIGTDWYHYMDYYNGNYTVEYNELGFNILIRVSKILGLSYSWFIFLYTSSEFLLLNRFLKIYNVNQSLYYFLIFAISPLLIIDQLRNGMALMIVLQSIPLFEIKNYKKAIVIVGLACLFHFSCAIFFILPFVLNNLRIKRRSIVILLLIGLVVSIVHVSYLDSILSFAYSKSSGSINAVLSNYIGSESQTAMYGLTIGSIEKLIILGIILLHYDDILSENKISRLTLNFTLLYILGYFFFSGMTIFITRFVGLFSLFYAVSVCQIISSDTIIRSKSKLTHLIILMFLIKTILSFSNPLYEYFNRHNEGERRTYIEYTIYNWI